MSCPALREKKKPLAGQLSFCTQIEIVWRRFTFRAAVSLRLQTDDDLQGRGSRWEVKQTATVEGLLPFVALSGYLVLSLCVFAIRVSGFVIR